MIRIQLVGRFDRGQVHAEWVPSSRAILPEVERAVESAWRDGTARLGRLLFDGPMCRLESWRADGASGRLHLRLSRTSFKWFYGTNLSNPHLADAFGTEVLANPVGISPALVTADGFLMLGRRNESVAYYPNRLHPFAGTPEPPPDAPAGRAFDVFSEVLRELREELSFEAADVSHIFCTGIAEDTALRQPEVIFTVHSTRTREQVESRVDDAEHHATWSVPATAREIESALDGGEPFTPVARASMLLYGRVQFGEDWFLRMVSDGRPHV
jgi:hypothetical protein